MKKFQTITRLLFSIQTLIFCASSKVMATQQRALTLPLLTGIPFILAISPSVTTFEILSNSLN